MRNSLATITLAILTVATARGDEPKSADLAWVPPGSAAFVRLRFHDLWTSPAGQQLIKTWTAPNPMVLDTLERELGLPLAHIDTVTIVMPAMAAKGGEPGIVVRLTTTKPYNRKEVLAALRVAEDDPDRLGAKSDLYRLPGQRLLHLGDDKTITMVAGREGALGLLDRMLDARKTGGLTPALTMAAGKDQIVAGLDLGQLPRLPLDALPAELRGLRTMLDAKTAIVTGTLGADKTALQIRFAFAAQDEAAEGKQALDDGLKASQAFLSNIAKGLNADSPESVTTLALIKDVQATLKAATVEQTGTSVRVTTEVSTMTALMRLVLNGVEVVQAGSYRTQSQNNLKQIGLAFHNYADTYQQLPQAAICGKDGKPLLSWRVAILPFIEQDNLYKQFHLDEPWDSDHNKKLIQYMPKIYRLPGDTPKRELPSTHYLAFVGNDAALELKTGLKFPASFPDGTSNTVWTAEAAEPVIWTKPDDFAYDKKTMPKLGYHFGDRVNVGFADGSVRSIKKGLAESTWHLLIQRSDGMVIPADAFEDR